MIEGGAGALVAGAATLAGTGRNEEACRLFRRALAVEPGHVAAILGLTRVLLAGGDLPAAAVLARQGFSLRPADVRIHVLQGDVGLALYQHGFWEDAEPLLERAAALEPWNTALAAALRRVRRPAYLAPAVHDPQLDRTLLRTAAREGDSYIFVIDIVGTCNLRCPTCPVGNSPERPKGFMSLDLFDRIIAKIRRESPVAQPQINLYNWGEPLLHPDLPVMIGNLRAHGMRSHLSTNLNIRRGLDAVIAANPDELKISLSGYSQATYGRAHARGDLELVKSNMHLIRASVDRHRATTRIWLGHHLYRSNRHEMTAVRELCVALGFAYHPIAAFYMPLERVVEVINGTHNPRDSGIVDDLLYSPPERAREAGKRLGVRFDCELRFNQTVINHDGTVALCCTVYDAPNMLGISYLDEAFAAIERRKYNHPFCRTCFAHNLQYVPQELQPTPGSTDH